MAVIPSRPVDTRSPGSNPAAEIDRMVALHDANERPHVYLRNSEATKAETKVEDEDGGFDKDAAREEYDSLLKAVIVDHAEANGVDSSGRKDDLIERLVEAEVAPPSDD